MKKILKTNVLIIFIVLLMGGVSVFAQETQNFKDKVPIFNVDTTDKKVALTFDLNWAEPDETYKILDVLDKHSIKGTFFVIGKWVVYPKGNDKTLLEISKRGHDIGNHSYEHPNFLQINRKQIAKEIVMTEKIIYDITGKNSKYFRFPSGAYTADAVGIINSMGLTCIQWSNDSVDWKNKGAQYEYSKVMNNMKPGDIILYHNNGKFTAENLDKIIPELKQQGYEIVTVDEILHKKEFLVNENGKQFKIS